MKDSDKLEIKIINSSEFDLPEYKYEGDAGMDLKANIDSTVTLLPFKRVLIPTGIQIALPKGYEAQVRGRSGLAINHGIIAHLGTIDAQYRGDIGVILFNQGQEAFQISRGDRIGQLVINKHETVQWVEVDTLDITDRDENGYGSTGVRD